MTMGIVAITESAIRGRMGIMVLIDRYTRPG